MTSIVKVTACCANDKEVRISVEQPTEVKGHITMAVTTLKNGESQEVVLCGDIVVSVKEVETQTITPNDIGDISDIL